MGFASVEEQLEILLRGCEQVHSVDELRKKLQRSRDTDTPLRIKLGLDPTAPDIHLGHTVPLRKVRQFQDLGHKAILIVGDYTAMIGDPSGRSKTRPVLTDEQIQANAQTYFEQAGCVLDMSPEKAEVVRNSEWLGPMSAADVIRLAGQSTVGQMLKRDDFRKRYEAEVPIGVHEFLYPLVQGQDSVAIRADIELGGTDQTFNFVLARDLQRNAGQEPQVVMTLPLLVGLDGVEKMSKSLGNYIGVTEVAHDMFGKSMRTPDECMQGYFTLLTSVPTAEIAVLCDPSRTHPMEAKKRLGFEVVTMYHSADAAGRARSEWEALHQKSAAAGVLVVPEGTPTLAVDGALLKDGAMGAIDLVVHCGFASSRGEARRLIGENGFRLNGEVVGDIAAMLAVKSGDVVQRGKRKFVRLEVS